MKKEQWILVAINIIGGIAVLGSYAYGIVTQPEAAPALWGDVPASIKPFYQVSMITAALGYLVFTWFIIFRIKPGEIGIGRFSYGLFGYLYAVILVPSALWMPLTFSMIAAPSSATWYGIRAVLSLVGVGSLALLASLAALHGAGRPGEKGAAVIGAVFFSLQTAVLDALVWTAYFPKNF